MSAPPVHYVATPEEAAVHLERWKAHLLAQKESDDERQMLWERQLRRDAEALRLEEEERTRGAAMPSPQQTREEVVLAVYQGCLGGWPGSLLHRSHWWRWRRQGQDGGRLGQRLGTDFLYFKLMFK